MPLFKIQVVVGFYCVADTIQDAVREGPWTAKKALTDGADVDVNGWAVKDARRVPAAWMDSLPYGGDGETKIRHLLASSPRPTDTRGEDK